MLARKSKVDYRTITRFEEGQNVEDSTKVAILTVFLAAGVTFRQAGASFLSPSPNGLRRGEAPPPRRGFAELTLGREVLAPTCAALAGRATFSSQPFGCRAPTGAAHFILATPLPS